MFSGRMSQSGTTTDMTRFPTSAHLASSAGLAPDKNKLARRNQSARIASGKRYLKVMLMQTAHGASYAEHTYLSALYRRVAA